MARPDKEFQNVLKEKKNGRGEAIMTWQEGVLWVFKTSDLRSGMKAELASRQSVNGRPLHHCLTPNA